MYKKYKLKIAICVLIIVISLLLYTGFEKETFAGESGNGFNIGFAVSIWPLTGIAIAIILLVFLLKRLLTSAKK